MAEISNDCWLNLAVSPLHSTFHSITSGYPMLGWLLLACLCVRAVLNY